MGGPRLNTMAKGKTMTPTPEGVISTSTGPVDPAVEEAVEVIEEELPEEELDQA